jgi:hypothetical protein
VAVGEAGSTTTTTTRPATCSAAAFAAQIQLAHARSLPLVIHTRDAWDDTFDVLAAEGVPERTIFHCFTGGPDEARRCLDIGAFVSFSGIVTFKNATDLREAATIVPLDRMLVETDAPYLAPVPHRGRTNQPAYVAHVAQCIADLRDVPVAVTLAPGLTLPGAAVITVERPAVTSPLGTAPAGFLEGSTVPESNEPARIAIPLLAESIKSTATFSSDIPSAQRCAVPGVPFNSTVTVTNLDNSRRVQCLANVAVIDPEVT